MPAARFSLMGASPVERRQPPFKQGVAGGVEIEAAGVAVEEGGDQMVRGMGVHRRSCSTRALETVTDRILHPQGHEVQAPERTVLRAHLDLDGGLRRKPIVPPHRQGRVVNVLFAAIGGLRETQEHTACDATVQVDAVTERGRALEMDPPGRRVDGRRIQLRQFLRQDRFESSRTGCKKIVICAIHAFSRADRGPL